MLRNAKSLVGLLGDSSYEQKISGHLLIQQGERWRRLYCVLKANLLFMFEGEERLDCPIILIILEDCIIEPADDNQTGREFSFTITQKTTGRCFVLATAGYSSLGNWISFLTISSIDYMRATRQSLLEQCGANNKAGNE